MAGETVDVSDNFFKSKIGKYLIDDAPASTEPRVAKIKRVPKYVRDRMASADNYFEPTELYLGPFHKGKNIPEECKRRKKTVASVFMRATGEERCSTAWKKIYNEIESLMKCYELKVGEEESKEGRMDMEEQQNKIRAWKEESSWMLFEDGCAILSFICWKDECFNEIDADALNEEVVTEDIFKIDNQIPYRVLTLLMESAFEFEDTMIIDNFIKTQASRIAYTPPRVAETIFPQDRPPITASEKLNIFIRKSVEEWILSLYPETTTLAAAEHVEQETAQSSSSSTPVHRVHLLQHLRERLVLNESEGGLKSRNQTYPLRISMRRQYRSSKIWNERDGRFSRSIPSAAALKSKNIRFQPIHSYNLPHIRSDPISKEVRISSVAISPFTKTILMNLAADEVSSDIPNSLEISSFLHFLAKLVDGPEDAKALREAKIIHNFLRNDEEAATFLNDAAVCLPTEDLLFGDVEKMIHIHIENDTDKWSRQLVNEYLTSPWAVLAIVGGMLVLSLTMLQTYVTVFPIPAELVQKGNQLKVISFLMKRMFTAVLLPLPLLLTLLWILVIIVTVLNFSALWPKPVREPLLSIVSALVSFATLSFGAYALYLQFH